MELLLKNVRIIDPRSSFHEQKVDLFIEQGTIKKLGSGLSPGPDTTLLEGADLCVSPGWFDLGAFCGEPGYEHRETLPTLQRAAMRGGYTGLAVLPNTSPPIHTKSEVRFLKEHSRQGPVAIYPIGALSEGCAGKDISEMIDMHRAGAVAFSDGIHPVGDAGLMLRALQYAKAVQGLIINHPFDPHVMTEGQMHEGLTSTELGLRGIPSMAEYLMVQRDLTLQSYAGSRLHLLNLSARESVQLVQEARESGLSVSCSTPVLNLIFEDKHLEFFDSNLKVLPPLRGSEDRLALLEGLRSGVIQVITSNHQPWDPEAKDREFPNASFGAIGLETVFALCRTHLREQLPLSRLVEAISIAPREVLGLEVPKIQEGELANLTVFDPEAEWVYEVEKAGSKSHNTHLWGAQLKGKPMAVINRGQFIRV